MGTISYFTILRYVPDVVRGEYINVGVALVAPNFFKVQLITDLSRLRALNPIEDDSALDYLSLHFAAIQEQFRMELGKITSVESTSAIFEKLLRDLVGQYKFLIQTSEIKKAEIVDYSVDKAGALLASLFERLVVTPTEAQVEVVTKGKYRRFKTEVKGSFRKLKILSEERGKPTEGKVIEAYPILIDQKKDWFWTDFGYRNGHDVLIDTIDFDSKDLREGVHRAAVTAIKFDLVKQHVTRERTNVECLSVIKLGKNKPEDFERQLFLLNTYSDKVFNLSISSEKNEFFEKIKDDLRSFLV